MNRKNVGRVLGIMMVVPMLAGCGKIQTKPESESPVEETATEETVKATEETENAPVENTEATEAPENEMPDTEADFKSFLEGNAKAKTAESLKSKYEEETYGGLAYGEYTLEELRREVAENQMTEAAVKYTYLDCNHDGIDELFVRFEALNSSFLSWTGVIRDTEDGLQICSSYEDGYRSYADLYKSGYHTYGQAPLPSGIRGTPYHQPSHRRQCQRYGGCWPTRRIAIRRCQHRHRPLNSSCTLRC